MTKKQQKKHITLTIMLVILTTVLSTFVSGATIEVVSLTDPLAHTNLQFLRANITSQSPLTNVFLEFENQNYSMNYNFGLYDYSWTPTNIGVNNYKIYAVENSQSTMLSDSFTVIDTTAPIITYSHPQGLTFNTIATIITAVTDEQSWCKYDYVDTTYAIMIYSFAGFNTAHDGTITDLSQGTNTIYIRCADNAGNAMSSSHTLTFYVDFTPPAITSVSPTSLIKSASTTLQVTTNEKSSCKNSKQNIGYADMTSNLQSSDSITHSITVSDLVQGINNYHVRCIDLAGNIMLSSTLISFSATLPPTSNINLGENTPLQEGTVKVTLISSKPLVNTPTLQYNYNDDSAKKTISLTGGPTNWNGFMIIPIYDVDKIGTFYFSGVDTEGLAGNQITGGEIFLVDTSKPTAPTSFRVENDDDRIKISLYYDSEQVDKYNIYRRESPGVEFVDFYDDTDDEHYYDDDVEEGLIYYYRVAVVDDAGNVGPLSSEQFSAIYYDDKKQQENIVESKGLNPKYYPLVNTTKKIIDKQLIDADWLIGNLESETDPVKVTVIKELSLMQNAIEARNAITTYQSQAQDLLKLDLDEEQLLERIQQLKEKAQNAKSGIVTHIEVLKKADYTPLTSGKQAVSEALSEIIIGLDLPKKQRSQLEKQSIEFNDLISTTNVFISARLDYGEFKDSQDFTIVQKTISATSEQSNVVLVEKIPKAVVFDASQISYSKEPTVLKKDPVVSWDFATLKSEKLSYVIEKIIDFNDLKAIQTVYVQNPSVLVQKETVDATGESKVTGNAVAQSDGFVKSIFSSVPLVLALIAIILLVVYYTVVLSDSISTNNNVLQKIKTIAKRDKTIISHEKSFEGLSALPAPKSLIYQNLELAKEKLRSLDFVSAYDLYKQSLTLEPSTIFEQQLVQEVYNQLMMVFYLGRAKAALIDKNHDIAREHTRKVESLYHRAGLQPAKDSKLINYVHEKYARVLDKV
ncbi:hypothetical protein GOV04_03105 [Candidatus Woesearchaeota archaeon]|nr:hypothetical protein [Candidatus Woesearchaeota archaeon]